MIAESLLREIDRGREGLNQGYSLGLPKLEEYIDGLCKRTSTLIFSDSGSGKSSLAIYSYVYVPLKQHLEDGKLKIDYFSLEISADDLMAKLLSLHLWDTYKVDISLKELLSRKKDYKLPDDIYKMVEESITWMHKVENVLTIHDKMLNADSMYAILMNSLKKEGTFKETEFRTIYTPHNPDLLHEVILDHASLLQPVKGRKLKEEMDLCSAYLVTLREKCNLSPLIVMQANRESQSMDRRKAGLNNLRLSDTKDTGNIVQDSQVVISIFNPHREKLNTYNHYNIEILRDTYRSLTVLKNRFGPADVEVGVNFFGHNGLFVELPKGKDINDFSKYTNPFYLLNSDNNETTDEEKIKMPKIEFKI